IPLTSSGAGLDWLRDPAPRGISEPTTVPPQGEAAAPSVIDHTLTDTTMPDTRMADTVIDHTLTEPERIALSRADPELIAALNEVKLRGASDLHITVNAPPMLRIDGALRPIGSSG